jgi:hypothetical protein
VRVLGSRHVRMGADSRFACVALPEGQPSRPRRPGQRPGPPVLWPGCLDATPRQRAMCMACLI